MLVLKVQSVCIGMEVVGESAAVALEVGQIAPSQLGNVCLRQYLSNRSLGKMSSTFLFCCALKRHIVFIKGGRGACLDLHLKVYFKGKG